MQAPAFAHLHVHSYFSFLDGSASPEELVKKAAELEMPAIALTDHFNVSGAVRFYRAAKEAGIKPILGAEVTLEGGYHLTLLAIGFRGYANLCRLLTRAHLSNPRGNPQCSWADLEEHTQGLIALSGCRRGEIPSLILRRQYARAKEAAQRYKALWGSNFYLELQDTLLPGNKALNQALVKLGEALNIPVVATNNVHYTCRKDFPVHDVLTCVRLGIKLEDVHPERPLNDENYLKSPAEMARIFAFCPQALHNTIRIVEMCQPPLDERQNFSPRFPLPPGQSANAFLRELVYKGAAERYGRITPGVEERLEKELNVISRLGFADYFLITWDIVNYARARGIRCAGRGSAGASAVAYSLGLTEVDPISRHLVFERFMSLERAEKPDIDIDFDSRYRDLIAAYVYKKYGEDHVAAVATYVTYQARSAVRDLGKVFGYSEEEIDSLAKSMPHIPADQIFDALERFPELRCGPWKEEKYRRLFGFCGRIAGFPRHLGTHLGGLVVTGPPVVEISPLQVAAKGIKICQFDRNDVEELGLVKLDLLSLKALSVLEEAAGGISRVNPGFRYEGIPLDDAETYRLLNNAQTVGVFQLESPAQRALQARLKAENIEDVVASLALIRPGPIKGNMVEPFIARRRGLEPISYLHPSLKPILEKTYGVVLFQEQVIAIASEVAGFTPGEADRLRRLMTHARSLREMREIGEEFVRRAVAKGIDEKTARDIFSCLEGYASYGFCEAHAAAFATTAYWTAYLSAHYPAYFFAALLNCQPMGYYSPATLANEARTRGIKFLPVDVNASTDRFTVEGGAAIRIPLSRVKGMRQNTLARILEARRKGPFCSLRDFYVRTQTERDTLENLILCGAFDPLHPNRKALLAWVPEVVSASPIQPALELGPPTGIKDFTAAEKCLLEYEILGMSADAHFMSFFRDKLAKEGYLTADQAKKLPDGRCAKVAGLPVRPHRPPTRSGKIVVFFSLEDETGLLDVTVFEDVYNKYGQFLFGPELGPLKVVGTVQHRRGNTSFIAQELSPLEYAPAAPHPESALQLPHGHGQ
ncbi:error-prone DNA polymerase [Thermanaeromonas toyohensis ToBE]|uniref:DNA-directed DNA polymerase n=1 Tax=Thermanaeromonas toyohensis ToBE TaxID=698762 RepID=A0A1W1VUT7_9FIRM|nr:DNA polymerase III subunit alpha [Thermanaeromonas toyohensis]SMB97119.1 error-prone DNA polymerase [Thermanaeromonas toyohensis ToBE]